MKFDRISRQQYVIAFQTRQALKIFDGDVFEKDRPTSLFNFP